MKVVVADKNAVVRAGLLDYLSRDGRFDVVTAVDSGSALIELCDAHRPLIAVCGWSLLDMTAGDALAIIRRRQLPTRLVIYAAEDSADLLRQAARGGAWGYVSRNDDPDVLLETLSTVSRGRLSLPYVDIERLTSDPIEQLTKRERELLGALAQGWTNLQIGARFGISGNTVKYHLKNLYDKLGVKNRAMAVALFMSSPAANSSSHFDPS
ncbi:MAG: response regulator transcription factor [Hyphomicrobiaceae bacterium]|nr:response regulator transcription factor [Hyphomicrobiaceae bacterium]